MPVHKRGLSVRNRTSVCRDSTSVAQSERWDPIVVNAESATPAPPGVNPTHASVDLRHRTTPNVFQNEMSRTISGGLNPKNCAQNKHLWAF